MRLAPKGTKPAQTPRRSVAYYCPVCDGGGEKKGKADLFIRDGIDDWLWWCAKCNNGKGMSGHEYMVALERSTGMFWSWLKAVGPEVAGFAVRELDSNDVPDLPSMGAILGWHSRLWSEPEPLDWLTERRGISRKVIEQARIGWDVGRRVLTFPMYHGGELVAYKTRGLWAGAQMVNCKGHGRPWPLYPAVRDVADHRGWVLLVAGELDALKARTAYLPGVSVTLGAGAWRDSWTEELRPYPVVVCFDNNERRQALNLVGELRRAGVQASRLDLRVLGLRTEKGDLSDYLNAGGSPGEFAEQRRRAPVSARDPGRRGRPRPSRSRGAQRGGRGPDGRRGRRRATRARAGARGAAPEAGAGLMADAKSSAQRKVRRMRQRAAANGRLDPKTEAAIEQHLQQLRIRQEAQRRLAAETERFAFPKPGSSLVDDLAVPPPEHKYVVKDLHLAGGNTLLIAQYKAGKTTLGINLLKSLADEEPFLGRFAVTPLDGRVAFWNYELGADLFREWMRDLGVVNPERVAEPLHLRGVFLPFWLPEVAEQAARWLKQNEIEFWIVDPAARAMNGLVVNENDNAQLAAFTGALDKIKRTAGVPNLLLTTHTSRARREEGEEQSRGGASLEDWMDVGWYLTKDGKGKRSLRAAGRDVDVEAFDLTYDGATRQLQHSGQTRDERRINDGLQAVVDALLAKGDGCNSGDLEAAMVGDKNERSRLIIEAEKSGLITREPSGRSKLCSLTAAGRKMAKRRVTRPKPSVRRDKL